MDPNQDGPEPCVLRNSSPEQSTMTTLANLPHEVIFKILSYLPAEGLSAVSQTCRHLNSASFADLLWQRLCEPYSIPTHSPFPCWRDLYTLRLHNWGFLLGIWCSDRKPRGDLSLSRYNPDIGVFDFHHILTQTTFRHSSHSVYPHVSITKFNPTCRPDPKAWLRIEVHDQFSPEISLNSDSIPIGITFPEKGERWHTSTVSPGGASGPGVTCNITERDYALSCVVPYETSHGPLRLRISDLKLKHKVHLECIGEEVVYQTIPMRQFRLTPSLTIPAPDKPYQGLWVGDYSAHGTEFLHFRQCSQSTLEVIKITGDPNVPMEEYSFVIPDLNASDGHITEEEDFRGCTVVPGYGQISPTGFRGPSWIPVRVILTSHDEIFVHWILLRHISNYKRVNLEEMSDFDYVLKAESGS